MASYIGKIAVACSIACVFLAMVHIGIPSAPGHLDTPTMQDEAALVQKEVNIHRRAANTEAEAEESEDTMAVPKRMSAVIDTNVKLCYDAPLDYINDCLLGHKPKKGDPKRKYYRGYRSPMLRATLGAVKLVEDGTCADYGYNLTIADHRKFYNHKVILMGLSHGDDERDVASLRSYYENRCQMDMECAMFWQTEGRVWRKKNPSCEKQKQSEVIEEEPAEVTDAEVEVPPAAPKKATAVQADTDEEDDKSGTMRIGGAGLQLLALLAAAGLAA
eukprot:gnl/TRDRNA2_/TRDRNA2_84447_c0_seq1.p1 gnl/TRDRNA2_/TRDRNA2_84447_c0~~gnl/TRDRNA2_/TRDRNA2_84447_c0_seq1.p1  ORF type:complete len:308 (-),score=64.95 gnl/TRDRNA2_/TRDRNA2_84447_c0_seq1:52-873(-)